ncbi:MAG: TraM recognition domain-containing protein, partial [Bacteroidales bacterium]
YHCLINSKTLLSLINPSDGNFKDTLIKIEANLSNLYELQKKGRPVVVFEDDTPQTLSANANKKLPYHPEAILYYLTVITQQEPNTINKIIEEAKITRTTLILLKDFAQIAIHFNEKFLAQPPDQLGGVTSTIFNYLMFFNEPEVSEVFSCEQNTFDFCEAIDNGKIIMLTMPQSKAVHRIFVNTTLKLLFYMHALSRFDLPKEEREKKNLIVLFADEAQGVVSKMEGGGFEDHAVADKIRQANATVVFATQDLMSYEAKIGKDRSSTLQLNLANKIVFKCATPETAEFYSKLFGKKQVTKKTGYSTGKQGKSDNFQQVDEPIYKDFELCTLRKFEAIVKHCEKPPVKMILPPVDSFGNITTWGKKIIKKLK